MPTQWTHGPLVRIFSANCLLTLICPFFAAVLITLALCFNHFWPKQSLPDLFSGDLTPHHRNFLAKTVTDLLKKLQFEEATLMTLIGDYQAALRIASNLVFYEKAKHIEQDGYYRNRRRHD